jgi:arylsulfatase
MAFETGDGTGFDRKSPQSRRGVLRGLLAASAFALAAGYAPLGAQTGVPVAPAVAKRPNIVVILVDDMGFSDISSYGSEIPTPNIDALAASGIKFSQFYNTARCSCSRASLLTGTYPSQAGLGHLEAIAVPGSKGLHGKLDDRVVTLAEVLRSAGYFTAMAGKWHVGMTRGVGPRKRGFDRSLASPEGGIYYPDQVNGKGQPMNLFIDGQKYPANAPEIGTGHWYSSDLFVDWDLKFMKEAEAQKKPFFLYLPFVGVHFPVSAPPEDIAKFKGKYMKGWDALRQARLDRQKKLGIVPEDTVLPERLPNTYNWDKLSAAERDRFDTMMAIYAADISRMDKAVGTLVEGLKAAGELDNTLILFLADNGGNAESGPDGIAKGPGPLGGPDSRVFVGMNWATLQNTPFQYFKHYTEEGGISTPLIAHWPNGIDPNLHGTWNRTPGHLVDIMATLVQVSGASYPHIFNGHDIIPMQGTSLVPAFHGQPIDRGKPIFWEHEGNRAVRDGRWKAVARFKRPWQLFDMTNDRTELHDLAASQPQIVKRLAAAWDEWAARSFVDQWDDNYDVYLNHRPRWNNGSVEVPKHPEAMDRSEPPEFNGKVAPITD